MRKEVDRLIEVVAKYGGGDGGREKGGRGEWEVEGAAEVDRHS